MPVNLDSPNISNQANLLTNTGNTEVASTKSTTGIEISQGIMEISEGGNATNITSTSGLPSLEAPTLALEKVLDTVVKISEAQTAQILGVAQGTAMNIADFYKNVFDTLANKSSKSSSSNKDTITTDANGNPTTKGTNVSEMDAEALDLYCLLLTQSSKEKMIKSFKEFLKTKISERTAKQEEYAAKANEVAKKNLDQIKEAEKAKKRAKFWGIFKACLSAFVAVAATALAIGVTAASFGSMGPVAISFAVTAIAASVVSTGLTLASSSVTIAALCTEDPEKQATLNKWSMGLGIAAAAVGIYAAILSGGATFGTSLSTLSKIFSCASGIISGCSQMATGAVDIYEGVKNIELAKLQRELADMKIDLTKLDETIALLNKLIETLSGDVEEFIKNLLEGEQQAAKELITISDEQANLAQEVPC